jgi:tetratricopeptide (TPR) repeat protein
MRGVLLGLGIIVSVSMVDGFVLSVRADNGPTELDHLFDALKAAQDGKAADAVAERIKRIWMRSGSDTADLILQRADAALDQQDLPLSLELLDRLVALEPDWAEAWNRRATVFFLMNDDQRSMADIAETLKREPRHYGAIAGMGLIFLHRGNKKLAYEAFQRVLAVYPALETAKKAVEELRPEIEGSPL